MTTTPSFSQQTFGLTSKYTGLGAQNSSYTGADFSVYSSWLFSGASGQGEGSVYVHSTNTGQQLFELKPFSYTDVNSFGANVAGNADYIVAVAADNNSSKHLLYVFETSKGEPLYYIEPDGYLNGSALSPHSLEIDGSTLVAGANRDGGTGVAYVFDLATGQQTLTLSGDAGPGSLSSSNFGDAVSISNDYFAIGAPKAITGIGRSGGGVFVFDRLGTQLHMLSAPDTQLYYGFGSSVSVYGNTVAVGAPNALNDAGIRTGAVYLFNTHDGSFRHKIAPETGTAGLRFGDQLDLRGVTLAVIARNSEHVYIYRTSSPSLVTSITGPVQRWTDVRVWNSTRILASNIGADSCDDELTGAIFEFSAGEANISTSCPNLPKCKGISATLLGTPGPDYLTGTIAQDVIVGLAGDDVIRGTGGQDYICGGSDDDLIYAGSGDDYVSGQDGADRVYGQNGNDILIGGVGNDYLHGGNGDDALYGIGGENTLHGGPDRDRLHGGSYNDKLFGGNEDDRLYGHSGNDLIYGGSGNDFIHGGYDDDRLFGQDGEDRIRSDLGVDYVNGGAGIDRCDLNNTGDILVACEQ